MGKKRVEPIKSEGRRKKELDGTVKKINFFYGGYERSLGKGEPNNPEDRKRAEKFFQRQTASLRNEVKTYMSLGYSEEEALTRVLPKAYALVKLGSKYLWNKPHYDVQLVGGILLNDGYASEMATGEGKTLTATLPAYLNGLLGKGVHIITPNGYLAKRDQEEMSELFNLLGLSCGLVEERGRIDPEELNRKTKEIVSNNPKVKKLVLRAKTTEERERIISDFIKSPENSKVVNDARREARKALKSEDLERRKRAYACDVTYGSSSAIAFDYLYDDISTSQSEVVQRPGMPNFAIVDEVDAVLFDDATTPFTLSGTSTDEEAALTEEEKKAAQKEVNSANYAVYKILQYQQEQKRRGGGGLVCEVSDDIFQNLTDLEDEDILYRYAIILDKETKEYKLTTLGETILFEYYRGGEINKILEANKDKILSMKFKGEPLFKEGYDYTIENGRIKMEPHAFNYLVTSGKIPELYDLFDDFGTKELSESQQTIDNALKAWFALEEGVDYMLTPPKKAKSAKERTISLIMNGRTAEGRVYSKGLQQAVEAKEKIKKGKLYEIKPTEFKNTLASIPTSSFFARYGKMGGMTGTAAIGAFRQLYGLETHEVPRNRPKQAIDYGDRFYSTSEEKNEAIFQSVLDSVKRGQPVLISTTSVEESEKLHEYLARRFKEEGRNIQIPVLNASVDKLEEEARIISQAGLPGQVTISTEMAGRGTDIKLGGEVPEVSEIMEKMLEEYVQKTMDRLKERGIVTEKNYEKKLAEVRAEAKKEKNQDTIKRKAEERHAKLKANRVAMERQVLDAGGLKVIGSGHFRYSRVDDQVKGRCGRQGNKGSMIFFNDPEDLARIGVSPDKISELTRKAPIIEHEGKCAGEAGPTETPLGDLIYEAQGRNEELTQESIKQTQESESEISRCRRELRAQREELKRRDDYIDAVDFMIEETTKSIISASSKKTNLRDKTKLSRAKIDMKKMVSLTEEFLGIKIDPKEAKRFRTVGELREYITSKGYDRLDSYVENVGEKEANAHCKEIVDKFLARAWGDFEEYVETIKNQDILNKMAGIQPIDGALQADISVAYRHCAESERAMIVREIINPEYRRKYGSKARSELEPVRVTSQGVQKVDDDYDAKVEELIELTKEDAKEQRKNKIANLAPTPTLFQRFNNLKLVKKSRKVERVKEETLDEDLVVQDFDDQPRKK